MNNKKTYNFTVDFERDVFEYEKQDEQIILIQNDNLSSLFIFEFQDFIPDYCSIILKARNESTGQLVETMLNYSDGKAEMLVERIMLLDVGKITLSLSLLDGDTLLTNLTYFEKIKIKRSLTGYVVSKVKDVLYYDILKIVQDVKSCLDNYFTKPEIEEKNIEILQDAKNYTYSKTSITQKDTAVLQEAATQLEEHNASTTAHTDIRALLVDNIHYKGIWTSGYRYKKNDIVIHDGHFSVCIQDIFIVYTSPPSNTQTANTCWQPVTTAGFIEVDPAGADLLDLVGVTQNTSGGVDFKRARRNQVKIGINGLEDKRGTLAARSDLVPIWSALDHLNLNKTDETDFEEHKTSSDAHKELFDMKVNKENWRLIRADTIINPITSMTINTDSEGNPFEIKGLYLVMSNWQTGTTSTANGGVYFNSTASTNRIYYNQLAVVSGAANIVRNLQIERLGYFYKPTMWYGVPNSTSAATMTSMPTVTKLTNEAITSVIITLASAVVTGTFEIWGVDV